MGGKGSGRPREKPYCFTHDVPLVGPDYVYITDTSPGQHMEDYHCPRDGEVYTHNVLESTLTSEDGEVQDYWRV
jgi:hypothetical protein